MLKLIWIIAVIILLGVSLFYTFPIAKVVGRSMLPTYKEGSLLLTTRLFNRDKLEVGQVYVFRRQDSDGEEHLVVKRLTNNVTVPHSDFNNLCYFEGDNPKESYDSRHYGFINAEDIVAKVLRKIKE